jgi:hypothetical protein
VVVSREADFSRNSLLAQGTNAFATVVPLKAGTHAATHTVQLSRDPRDICVGLRLKGREAAGDKLRHTQTLGTRRPGVIVDVLDLSIVCVDAR